MRYFAWMACVLLWAAGLVWLPEVGDRLRANALEERLQSPSCRSPQKIIAELAALGPVGMGPIVRALDSHVASVAAAAQRALWREINVAQPDPLYQDRVDTAAEAILEEFAHWRPSTRSAVYPLLRSILDSPRLAAKLRPDRLESLHALVAELESVREGGPALSEAGLRAGRSESSAELQSGHAQERVARHLVAQQPVQARVRLESGSTLGVRNTLRQPEGMESAEGAKLGGDTAKVRQKELDETHAERAVMAEIGSQAFAESESAARDTAPASIALDAQAAVYSFESSHGAGHRSFGPLGGGVQLARDEQASPDGSLTVVDVEHLPDISSEASDSNPDERDGRAHAQSGGLRDDRDARNPVPPQYAIPQPIRSLFLQMVSGSLDEQEAAIEALRTRVRSPGVIQAGRLVFSPSPDHRQAAIGQLWMIPDIDPLPFLFELAKDPEATVRREALLALVAVPDETIRRWAVSSCHADESPEIRILADSIGGSKRGPNYGPNQQ